MQDVSKAPDVMISRYAYKAKFVKNEKGDMESDIALRLALRFLRRRSQERRGCRVSDCSPARQRAGG
eukprot:1578103-Pyramimonas_sp.AAC.1